MESRKSSIEGSISFDNAEIKSRNVYFVDRILNSPSRVLSRLEGKYGRKDYDLDYVSSIFDNF